MTEPLAADKGLVKRRVADRPSGKMHPPFVEAFADRIHWILAHRSWSMRELSTRAGLQPTHLATIMKKEIEGPRSLVAMVTVVKIARAAGVTVEWLATGEGPRDVGRGGDVDPYPNRRRAVRAARELGLSERAIESVLTDSAPQSAERRATWWFDRIRAQETLLASDDPPTPLPSTPTARSGVRHAEKPPSTRKSHKL